MGVLIFMFIITNNKKFIMKNSMILVFVACALTLVDCGGGEDDNGTSSALSRAEDGIWSNLNNAADTNMMQSIILSDGAYWGIVGQNFGASMTPPTLTTFCVDAVLHGTASINGSSVSGTYTDYTGFQPVNGTYSGTVSTQSDLNLTFNDPLDPMLVGNGANLHISYDGIYNQPASLSEVTGSYLNQNGKGCPSSSIPGAVFYYIRPNVTISGSNLTLVDQGGNVIAIGTVTPHGTTVNVFDVSLTTAAIIPAYSMAGLLSGGNDVPAGTIYKGILFQTSSGILKNNIEILAAAGSSAYFYTGSK
jgi:hypothetical protein